MSVCPTPPSGSEAETFMAMAAEQAMKGRGATAPNPCVGAVLVQDGHVVAHGFHTAYGEPHAEVECIRNAQARNVDMKSCTLYVTLEPCNHQGKTPPCTRAILDAGIPSVIIGAMDPNPNVSGGGAKFLREQGVMVTKGVLNQVCKDLIADFMTWNSTPRTYNILKLATTLDGKIATRTGHSKWISGENSRELVHEIRGQVQAVVVGGGTFYADDPQLTRRAPGMQMSAGSQPMAVVVTSRLPEPEEDYYLLSMRPTETVFWTNENAAHSSTARRLRDHGVHVWSLPNTENGLDLAQGFAQLRSELGCYYTMCEGGGGLALSMIREHLADELLLFMAPKILADEQARNLFTGASPLRMDNALQMRVANTRMCGEDILMTLRPADD